jgi:DNA gyrase B subunit, carboxyl terminus
LRHPAQLKETTMDPAKRTLLRVVLLTEDRAGTADSVERLMGYQGRSALCLHFRQGGIRQRGSAGRVAIRPRSGRFRSESAV